MRCEEIMSRDVECSYSDESVQRAADRMRWRNIGFLPVLDDHERLIGAITDRDLTVRVLASGLPPDTRVGEVASTGVLYCSPHDSVHVAEELMVRFRVSRVVCIDSYGRPVGIVSLSDIAEADWTWRTGDVVRSVAAREARAH